MTERVLENRYQIVRSIKSGGMGSVYEAIDLKLANSPCAVKEVLESALKGPDSDYVLKSFESEMKALANLEHPGIPRVRDYFEIEGKRYIVLDLIVGQSLMDELEDRLDQKKGPMDATQAARDMVTVLETLNYLHTLQPPLLHRDVKPANLIRQQSTGQVKLVDFGIAKSLAPQAMQTQVGTLGYSAPEQLSGRPETRSDIYSVGATLYHLTIGHPLANWLLEPLDEEVSLLPGLAKIISKAAHPVPAQRYATALEMAEALRNWLSLGTRQIPAEAVEIIPATTPAYPTPTVWPKAALAVAAGAALFLLPALFRGRPQSPPPTSTPTRMAPVVAVRTPTKPEKSLEEMQQEAERMAQEHMPPRLPSVVKRPKPVAVAVVVQPAQPDQRPDVPQAATPRHPFQQRTAAPDQLLPIQSAAPSSSFTTLSGPGFSIEVHTELLAGASVDEIMNIKSEALAGSTMVTKNPAHAVFRSHKGKRHVIIRRGAFYEANVVSGRWSPAANEEFSQYVQGQAQAQ